MSRLVPVSSHPHLRFVHPPRASAPVSCVIDVVGAGDLDLVSRIVDRARETLGPKIDVSARLEPRLRILLVGEGALRAAEAEGLAKALFRMDGIDHVRAKRYDAQGRARQAVFLGKGIIGDTGLVQASLRLAAGG